MGNNSKNARGLRVAQLQAIAENSRSLLKRANEQVSGALDRIWSLERAVWNLQARLAYLARKARILQRRLARRPATGAARKSRSSA